MLTKKRENDPVMILSILNDNMEIAMSSLFYFSDLGQAMQHQLSNNLHKLVGMPEGAVVYLVRVATDEDILTYEQTVGNSVENLSDRLEEMSHAAH